MVKNGENVKNAHQLLHNVFNAREINHSWEVYVVSTNNNNNKLGTLKSD